MLLTEYDEERQRMLDRQDGENKLAELIVILLDKDLSGEVEKAVREPIARQELYKRYGLE